MMRLTIISQGHRITGEYTPDGIVRAAEIIKANREHFERVGLVIALQGSNNIVHLHRVVPR